jgi:hypothetical protein
MDETAAARISLYELAAYFMPVVVAQQEERNNYSICTSSK